MSSSTLAAPLARAHAADPLAARLTFEASPLSVGRDFVVYAARLDGERVAVKVGLHGRAASEVEPALAREHAALVALGKRRDTAAVVPRALGLTHLGDGRLALVTSFVEGLSLATVIERALVRHRYQGARRWNAPTRALVAALARAVGAVHGAGWVHNDLKPDNVLVRDDGAGGLAVVLLDFAWAAKDGAGGPGGTVSYAAPERLEGASGTIKSDVWALGAMVYELLAGTRPYPADAPADALLERRHPVDRLPRASAARAWSALPEVVRQALTRALALDPRERTRHAARFVKDLDLQRADLPAAAAPPPRAEAARPRPAREGGWRVVLGALLVFAGGALAIGLGLVATRHGTGQALGMCLDAAGHDACRGALASPAARVLGVPVAAWAAALHTILLMTTVVRLVTRRGDLALLVLVGALLAGTGAYLVIGLVVVDVRCSLCLAMHGAALAVAVGGLLVALDRRDARLGRDRRSWAGALVALAAWVALGLALGRLVAPGPARAAPPAPRSAAVTTSTCPAALVSDPLAAPTDAASVVLVDARGRADKPVLIEYLDLACDACRAAHATLGPLYRELVQTRAAGVRLVLGYDDDARDDVAARAAPAALVCAARHGGGLAALDFIDWELRASPGYYRPEDRRRWLTSRLGLDAAACLDGELRARDGGSLAAHAAWVADARAAAATTPACRDAEAQGAWWCWVGTPSFGVFRRSAAPTTTGAAALDAGLATASEAARESTIRACLEP